MKILILLSKYLPDQGPNVFRWSQIAEAWVKQGHEVDVITPKRHDTPSDETIHGVKVRRTGHATLYDWAANILKMRKLRGRHQMKNEKTGANRFSGMRRILEFVIDITWRKIYWPDGSRIWMNSGFHQADHIVKAMTPDVIITVCRPFTNVMIGRKLTLRYPTLKWLIDIEDPFSVDFIVPPNHTFFYKKKNRRFEEACFRDASAIVMTNEVVKDLYASRLDLPLHKVHVIPPLWVPPEMEDTKLQLNLSQGKIHCAYIGAFYDRVREPEPLLKFLELLMSSDHDLFKKMDFHFFGIITPVMYRRFNNFPLVKKNMHFHGFRRRDFVFNAMQRMDFLVNLDNASDYHLPSKVVDYYASGRPVVNVCQIRDGGFHRYFSDYPAYFAFKANAPDSNSRQITALSDFLSKTGKHPVSPGVIEGKLKPHGLEVVAKAYLEAID